MKALTPVVIFLLAFAATSQAAERRIYETISSPQMKLLLTDAGYTGIEINGNDDLTVTMNDYHVLVVVRGNKYQNIQFRFAIRAKATLDFVNTWNKEKSYTKAYLDNDGDPVIEMDLELTGGVTEERIKDGVATFSNAMATFLKDLG
jgi:Putative bacterial sensory transduction regulator